MKTVTKLAVATLLALSALTPAFADEQDTLAERNTYLYTPEGQPIARHAQGTLQDTRRVSRRSSRGANAFASEPAPATGPDFSILSVH